MRLLSKRRLVQYWTAPFFPVVDTLPIDRIRKALKTRHPADRQL